MLEARLPAQLGPRHEQSQPVVPCSDKTNKRNVTQIPQENLYLSMHIHSFPSKHQITTIIRENILFSFQKI